MIDCTAIIAAAGKGLRMGGSESKVFLELAGRPVILHAVQAFAAHPSIGEIVLVVRAEDCARAEDLLRSAAIDGRIIPGGRERRDSVLAGLHAAQGQLVLIHDGARPFPSRTLIDRVMEGAIAHGACVPVLPSVDTLRVVNESGFLEGAPLDRARIGRMQTPQAFRRDAILSAIETSPSSIPDDAASILASGGTVFTVPGEETNLKVTVPGDLDLAERIAPE